MHSLEMPFGADSLNLNLTLTLSLVLLNPQISWLRHSVDDYYHAKFQVIAIRGFCCIYPPYPPTHVATTHTHHTHTHTPLQTHHNIGAAG